MIKKIFRWFAGIGLIALALLMGLAAYTNVDNSITSDDISVFNKSFGLWQQVKPSDYSNEIALIRTLQEKGFALAPLGEGIPNKHPREPVDLIRAAQGLCYDRSRTFDKVLTYAGFDTRHVFILYKKDKSFFRTLTQRGSNSHAATEVKTSRGWLLVDSNSPWIAVTRNGDPVDAKNMSKHLAEFDDVPPQLLLPYWAIRGMYSRTGELYPPYIAFPDFNWRDFIRATIYE